MKLNLENEYISRTYSVIGLIGQLGKILSNILISLVYLFLSVLSDLSGHHALLILKQAVRPSEKAVQCDNLLQEAELGIYRSLGFFLLLIFNSFLQFGLYLIIYLRAVFLISLTDDIGSFFLIYERLLDQGGDLVDVGLVIERDGHR